MRIEKLDQFSEGMFSVFPISSIKTGSSNYGGNTIVTSALTTKFVAGSLLQEWPTFFQPQLRFEPEISPVITRILLETCEPVHLAPCLPSSAVNGPIERPTPRVSGSV